MQFNVVIDYSTIQYCSLPADASLEDSEQERQRSAKEVEELQQQLSKAAADAWMKAAECVESC